MTDLYIKTPTQADYDALMRLAEAVGYVWNSRCKPTEEHNFDRYGCETVVRMRENMLLEYCDKPYYEVNQGAKVETIPNLAEIESVWKVKADVWEAFVNEYPDAKGFITHDYIVLIAVIGNKLEWCASNPYDALAVEYKPKESEDIMPEKVKLPRNVIDVFSPALDSPGYRILGSLTPIRIISDMYNRTLEGMTSDVAAWLNDYDNQWKLIDALRYGYEAEPEQLYYVPLIKNDDYYLNLNTETGKVFLSNREQGVGFQTKLTMPEIIAIDPRYKAFAAPVEEVDGNE